ncbi:GntR family transcriptional regulator [Streptomyces kanamyceticus]|uniref:GntR family transcriptional regulator n=1 Tax=Streptomyces kanamyceticus TaxID=1967 RepID=A0A5J6GL60_STRKN|nr:GntR family transcriptional regulator [Streptomyces kanamyceticus]QEU94831.1 GntR family transcriptional regulator [Streptomyces kanamyceticus]
MTKKPLARPRPMYLEMAHQLATQIRNGEYKSGDLLPFDGDLVETYGVSKHTVRSAIAELRSMGLVYTRHGKGTIVRDRGGPAPAVTIDRSIQRTGKAWRLSDLPEHEAPAVTRTVLEGHLGAMLDQVDQDAISVDRLLSDPTTGTRAAHRMLIPLATAAEVPSLAEVPDAPPSDLLKQLSDAGKTLTFTEHVTARAPYPDERTALGLTDHSPLLISYRITAESQDGEYRPLLCEELRAPAATCEFVFAVTPAKAAAKRAPRRPASA